MTTFYTSDPHLFHPRVSEIRGYSSIEEHNDAWASLFDVVKPNDTLYILGDFIGRDRDLQDALNFLGALRRGPVHLVAGNHDPCHPSRSESVKYHTWYESAFDTIAPYRVIRSERRRVHLSHFPYDIPDGHADRNPEEVRWREQRLTDIGHPLLHGHTHTTVKEHGHQLHIGWDAWGRFVHESEVAEWVRTLNGTGLGENT